MATTTARDAALDLAETILTDIELGRVGVADVARRASRLARLLDEAEAMAWLSFEVQGYPAGPLGAAAFAAARRSSRLVEEDGSVGAVTMALGEVDAMLDAYQTQIKHAKHYGERNTAIANLRTVVKVRDRVVGAIHDWVATRYHGLRFGAAVENAFQVVRIAVDDRVSDLVPEATVKLAAAFENASSENSEHWASAAATCRRLLKAAADALQPPGPDVNGRKMGLLY